MKRWIARYLSDPVPAPPAVIAPEPSDRGGEWRIVRDPHDGARFEAQAYRRLPSAGFFVGGFWETVHRADTEEGAAAWIEREKLRPIVVRIM